MLHYIKKEELEECLSVIHAGFATVAQDFGLTQENAPTNGAFMDYNRLLSEFQRCEFMVGSIENGRITGFASLVKKDAEVFELDKLAVLPEARHNGTGRLLVEFCAVKARSRGGKQLVLGMIEENTQLKDWYTSLGFAAAGTRVFEHLPFTVCFMKLDISKRRPDIPTESELIELVGQKYVDAFLSAAKLLESVYDVPTMWDGTVKEWRYGYKFRRGGKTLCAFYAKPDYIGCMFVLGVQEQAKFEKQRESFSSEARAMFDEAKAYMDGKWLMMDILSENAVRDMLRLCAIKRKPNKKVISLCGVVCSSCEYYPADCLGCHKIKGAPFWLQFTGEKVCGVFDCCTSSKKLINCAYCSELPCALIKRGDPTKTADENAIILKNQLKNLKSMAAR